MTAAPIKTSSWFTKLPDDHARIGISRGQPRNAGAGYRMFRKLAPGPWFNSVEADEYYDLYKREILAPLNPRQVATEIVDLAAGRTAVLLCFEAPNGKLWCHRAMAAEWLAEALGHPVPEYNFEQLAQAAHPLMPAAFRREVDTAEPEDVSEYVGRSAMIDGATHLVTSVDPANRALAIVTARGESFSTGLTTLRRHFR